MSLKLASVGGGPAGLFTALLLKQADPGAECVVYERNRADDTFGFGVVFSAETLGAVEAADPVFYARMAAEFRSWSAIDTDFLGTVERSDGHAFAAFERKRLLQLLAERAQEVGVDVRFSTVAPTLAELSRDNDVVIGADGVNSAVRRELADQLHPSTVGRPSKYIWLGTSRPFDCFTFLFVETEHGLFWAHVYPYADGRATFIVETDEETWERAGLAEGASKPRKPGENDEAAIAFCQRIFAEHLDGHELVGNNSGWLSFTVLKTEHWSAGNVVLAGDAVHTAHFSIGSGTKLALEDAIALAHALHEESSVEAALKAYEAERQPAVASVQRAAQTSLEWFEGVARYRHLPPEQFTMQLLTRSQRVTYDNLKLRDADYVARFDAWLAERTRSLGIEVETGTPPMFHPYRLKGLELDNRVVVSPMAQYSAVDGLPTDWHLVHLASRAVGGAGLVMTEMTCTSPQARITPGCPGIWDDEQEAAWARIVDVVHSTSRAKIGLQIGHAGPKGSTRLMWEGIDQPLETGGWEVVAPSPVPYLPTGGQVPRELDEAGIRDVVAQHVAAAERGARAGFDLLELHFAHGYLVSSFISPLTNHRTDGYGGDLHGRARLGLEVLRAVREVWPEDRPISVRISATDWVEGGTTGDDAVELARLLAEAGADIIDVSTGQTSTQAKPAYGRLYQTPFADRIRQEVGVPTMTVGAVSSVEDVNTIVATGRADLVALARPHLVDPYWTLNAAIDQGFRGHPTPVQYRSGLRARRRAQQP